MNPTNVIGIFYIVILILVIGVLLGIMFCKNIIDSDDKNEEQSNLDLIDDKIIISHGDRERIERKLKGIKRFECTTCYCEFYAPAFKYKEVSFDDGVSYKCTCPECGAECWDNGERLY